MFEHIYIYIYIYLSSTILKKKVILSNSNRRSQSDGITKWKKLSGLR